MDKVNVLKDEVQKARNELKNIRQQTETLRHSHKKEVSHLTSLIQKVNLNQATNQQRSINPHETEKHKLPDDHSGEHLGLSDDKWCLKPIGYIQSVFKTKNGTPRQGSVCDASKAVLTLQKDLYTNPEHSLEGLSDYSHIWVIYIFHKNNNLYTKAKVKPPRLNGAKLGLFATRSPYRPNPIGLSLVKIDKIEGSSIHLSGIDILDGTPVLDIKPYIPDYDLAQNLGAQDLTNHSDNVNNDATEATDTYISEQSSSGHNAKAIAEGLVNLHQQPTLYVNDDCENNVSDDNLDECDGLDCEQIVVESSSGKDKLLSSENVASSKDTTNTDPGPGLRQGSVNNRTIDAVNHVKGSQVRPLVNASEMAKQLQGRPLMHYNPSKQMQGMPYVLMNQPQLYQGQYVMHGNPVRQLHGNPYRHVETVDHSQRFQGKPIVRLDSVSQLKHGTNLADTYTGHSIINSSPRAECSNGGEASADVQSEATGTVPLDPDTVNKLTGTACFHSGSAGFYSGSRVVAGHSKASDTVNSSSKTENSNPNYKYLPTSEKETLTLKLQSSSTSDRPVLATTNNNVKYADWLKCPPIQPLKVVFTPRALEDLDTVLVSQTWNSDTKTEFFKDKGELKRAIESILQSDPRSAYRRKQCEDKLYYFTLDRIHITCWFDGDVAEVVRLKLQQTV